MKTLFLLLLCGTACAQDYIITGDQPGQFEISIDQNAANPVTDSTFGYINSSHGTAIISNGNLMEASDDGLLAKSPTMMGWGGWSFSGNTLTGEITYIPRTDQGTPSTSILFTITDAVASLAGPAKASMSAFSAPEIDPNGLVSGLTLLAIVLAILSSRRHVLKSP